MFTTFGRELAKTFKARLGLEDEAADLMAGVLEKQAVEMEGVSYAHYAQVSGRTINLEREATVGILRGALEFLYETSKVGALCDVPFIAGYAQSDEHNIYIDRSVPERKIFRSVDVPVHKLLNVHERVEKVILENTEPRTRMGTRLRSGWRDASPKPLEFRGMPMTSTGDPWRRP
jgi:hypothetical protein